MANIQVVYQTENPAYTRARAANQIGILVHSTGANNKYLKRYVDAPQLTGVNTYNNHWNKKEADKCMHAFVGLDINKQPMVIQTLPYEYACSGCGKGEKGSYNYNPTAHIQFEICQGSDSDSEYYWKIIKTAEEYCAHLCRKFDWTSKNITSHVEAHKAGYASNHGDPSSWMKNFGDSMDKFRLRVAALLEEDYQAPVYTSRNYRVTGNHLAHRAEPTLNAEVLTRIDYGTTITGLQVDEGWVKVKYNGKEGYCMLNYLEEIRSAAIEEEKMSMIYKYEVIGNRLAFRSAPNSEEDNIILRLETGTTIVGGESKNDWTPCEYGERIGYCMSKYLKLLEVNPDGDFQPSDKEKLDILWKEYLKNNK